MPGWFVAFLSLLFLLLLVAGLALLARNHRRNRGEKLAMAYIEAEKLVHDEDDEKEAREKRLKQGMVMWKYAFGSVKKQLKRVGLGNEEIRVSRRDVGSRSQLDASLQGTDHKISFRDILAVQLGPISTAHSRVTDDKRVELSFSIVTKSQTLDLEALTIEDFRDWWFYLQERYESRQRWAGLPLYTPETLECAQSNITIHSRVPPKAFDFTRSFEQEVERLAEEERNKRYLELRKNSATYDTASVVLQPKYTIQTPASDNPLISAKADAATDTKVDAATDYFYTPNKTTHQVNQGTAIDIDCST
eukprot:TRINITY_DN29622_c0_g1_i1.p1 TRINITY_DN29622_c0_g1~~TRINITY_DN29622_c0_g1_i1.p1  ORF type:complete len:305 (+),score=51.60 TRINITY_DN29622_c0_g1_i1:51-965(+)